MSILGHRGLYLKPAVVAPTGPTLVGTTYLNGGSSASMTYPAASQSGDLMVLVIHSTGGQSISGWTSAFLTAADGYGYTFQVLWKIRAAETTVTLSSGTGFENSLLAFRGATSVSSSNWVQNATLTGGASNSTTLDYAGHTVAMLSDRGASSSPTISTTGRTDPLSYSGATYFRMVGGYYSNHASGLIISYTDFNDTYGSTGFRFRILV